jgi:hypothetical protein
MLRIPGGVFENTVGSGCGGFPVVDGSTGRFFSGYQAIGGKPLVGRPLSRSWPAGGRTLQAFDTLVLATVGQPAGGPPVTRPIGLVSQLARNVPSLLAASGMPRPEAEPAGSVEGRRRLLTDPRIAGFYLGAPVEAASQVAWQVADGRFGSPISRPQRTATGLVRQAFEKVVIEVDQDGSTRLAEVGPVAVKAGLVPAWALRAQPVPGLPDAVPADPGSASSRRLLAYLAAALAAWALLTVVLLAGWRLRTGRAAARATATPAPPPGAGRSAPVGSRPASPDT